MLWAFMIFLAIIIKANALEDNSKRIQKENLRVHSTNTSIQFKNAKIELVYDDKKPTQQRTHDNDEDSDHVETNEEVSDRLDRQNDNNIQELRVKFNVKPKNEKIDKVKFIKNRLQNKHVEDKKGLRNKTNEDETDEGDVNSKDDLSDDSENEYVSSIENELPDDINKQSSPGREKKYKVKKYVDNVKINDQNPSTDNKSVKKGKKGNTIKTDAALGLDKNSGHIIFTEAGLDNNDGYKIITGAGIMDTSSEDKTAKSITPSKLLDTLSEENDSYIKNEHFNKKIQSIDDNNGDNKPVKRKTKKQSNSLNAHKLYVKQPPRKKIKHKIKGKVGGNFPNDKESTLNRDKYKRFEEADDDDRLTDVRQSKEITNTREVIESALQKQLLAHPEKYNGNKRKKYKIKLVSDSSEEPRNNGFRRTKNVLEEVEYSDNAISDDDDDDDILTNTRREISMHKENKEDNHKTIDTHKKKHKNRFKIVKNKRQAHEDTKVINNPKTERKMAEIKENNQSKVSKSVVKRRKNKPITDVLSRDEKHKLDVKKFLQSEPLIEMLADQLVKESLKNEAKRNKNEVFEIMI